MKRAALGATFAIGAVLAGCLLTTPLDGFSDSSGQTPARDDSGALPGTDAGMDGSIDSAVEGGPPSVDGGPRADFRCAVLSPAPSFCADFDTGDLAANVGAPVLSLGGQAVLDDTSSVSPARSLKLTTPALNTGMGPTRARATRAFGFVPANSIRVELDMRIDSSDKTATNAVSVSLNNYDISLFLGSSAKLREGIPGQAGIVYTTTDQTAPKAAAWFHLSLLVTLAKAGDSSTSTVTVSYDGVAQGAVPVKIEQYLGASWRVDLGINYVEGPDTGHDVHIDNVVIDAK
jgi:hypothetical protein